MPIPVPELLSPFVRCGEMGAARRSMVPKRSVFHRNLEGASSVGRVIPTGWSGLGLFAMLPLFSAPAHECFYNWYGDENDPCGMGLPQAEPHIEKPSGGSRWVDSVDKLR